jgi:hypothetical protein
MARILQRPTKPETVAIGYAGSGLSRWSRSAASRMNWTPRERKRSQPKALLIEATDALAVLRKQLRTVSPTERGKLVRSIMIKQKFADRLLVEIGE